MEGALCSASSLLINCFTVAGLLRNIRNETTVQEASTLATPVQPQSRVRSFVSLVDQLFLGFSVRRLFAANMAILRNRMVFVGVVASSIGAIDPLGDRGIFTVGQVYILGGIQLWLFFIVLTQYFGSWMMFLLLLQTKDKNFSFAFKRLFMGVLILGNLAFVIMEVVGVNFLVNNPICPILYKLFMYSSLGIVSIYLMASSSAAYFSIKSLKECEVQGKQSGKNAIPTIFRKQSLISCLFVSAMITASSNAIFDLPTTTCRGEFEPRWVFFLFQFSITLCWAVVLMFNWIWNLIDEAPGKSTDKNPNQLEGQV